jgi:hypothetical protein
MKSKEHLTIEGLAKIEEIKSNTNTKRIYLVSNSTNFIYIYIYKITKIPS